MAAALSTGRTARPGAAAGLTALCTPSLGRALCRPRPEGPPLTCRPRAPPRRRPVPVSPPSAENTVKSKRHLTLPPYRTPQLRLDPLDVLRTATSYDRWATSPRCSCQHVATPGKGHSSKLQVWRLLKGRPFSTTVNWKNRPPNPRKEGTTCRDPCRDHSGQKRNAYRSKGGAPDDEQRLSRKPCFSVPLSSRALEFILWRKSPEATGAQPGHSPSERPALLPPRLKATTLSAQRAALRSRLCHHADPDSSAEGSLAKPKRFTY